MLLVQMACEHTASIQPAVLAVATRSRCYSIVETFDAGLDFRYALRDATTCFAHATLIAVVTLARVATVLLQRYNTI